MFCLYTFPAHNLNFHWRCKVMGLNPGCLLKSFLLFKKKKISELQASFPMISLMLWKRRSWVFLALMSKHPKRKMTWWLVDLKLLGNSWRLTTRMTKARLQRLKWVLLFFWFPGSDFSCFDNNINPIGSKKPETWLFHKSSMKSLVPNTYQN